MYDTIHMSMCFNAFTERLNSSFFLPKLEQKVRLHSKSSMNNVIFKIIQATGPWEKSMMLNWSLCEMFERDPLLCSHGWLGPLSPLLTRWPEVDPLPLKEAARNMTVGFCLHLRLGVSVMILCDSLVLPHPKQKC